MSSPVDPRTGAKASAPDAPDAQATPEVKVTYDVLLISIKVDPVPSVGGGGANNIVRPLEIWGEYILLRRENGVAKGIKCGWKKSNVDALADSTLKTESIVAIDSSYLHKVILSLVEDGTNVRAQPFSCMLYK